jgi:uracil-DNA glycosylase
MHLHRQCYASARLFFFDNDRSRRQLPRLAFFDSDGLKREEVYIANVMKCRPPANRVPERSLG